MDDAELLILNFAAITREAAAVSDAALAGDMDEARFRALVLAGRAEVADFSGVELAVSRLIDSLGRAGNPPGTGVGAGMLLGAEAIDEVARILNLDGVRPGNSRQWGMRRSGR